MNWNYKSGIAKQIIQAAGQEVIELIEEIKAQDNSEKVGTIEYTQGGEIEYLLFNTKCQTKEEIISEDKSKMKIPLRRVLEFFTEKTDETSICIPIMIYGDLSKEIIPDLVREYYKVLSNHFEKYPDSEKEINFCAEDKYSYEMLCNLVKYHDRWVKKQNEQEQLFSGIISFD